MILLKIKRRSKSYWEWVINSDGEISKDIEKAYGFRSIQEATLLCLKKCAEFKKSKCKWEVYEVSNSL